MDTYPGIVPFNDIYNLSIHITLNQFHDIFILTTLKDNTL